MRVPSGEMRGSAIHSRRRRSSSRIGRDAAVLPAAAFAAGAAGLAAAAAAPGISSAASASAATAWSARMARLLHVRRQLLVEVGGAPGSAVERGERELLVGAVDPVVGEPEAHEDHGQAEQPLE